LSFPVVTWFYQREAIWISLPFAFVMAGGGLITAVGIWRRLPSTVFFSTALTIVLGILCVSVWILPFVDSYKSGKPFSLLIKKTVPLTQPLYIYADTMNDFNFYTEREIISVLSSPAEVEKAASGAKMAYVLIKERDLSRVDIGAEGKVLAESRLGDKKWYLVLVRR